MAIDAKLHKELEELIHHVEITGLTLIAIHLDKIKKLIRDAPLEDKLASQKAALEIISEYHQAKAQMMALMSVFAMSRKRQSGKPWSVAGSDPEDFEETIYPQSWKEAYAAMRKVGDGYATKVALDAINGLFGSNKKDKGESE